MLNTFQKDLWDQHHLKNKKDQMSLVLTSAEEQLMPLNAGKKLIFSDEATERDCDILTQLENFHIKITIRSTSRLHAKLKLY